ncbi:MAG: penicillin-binding protein 2 [Sulfuricurvum sp.]|uniref:penicillin-binding protein 2 n=1 Tax=Sulfuricurvum sp. TaxID=2025608 RepID=UPI002607F2AD|nr:penicillin-binding protein 2 [Sulfuricurvum sp.]MDD2829504.1 penicillin-binding protein 2 [Sulfuricurvum sp.]MDD4949499.1 penicillin-binding protein 2 [Sulfuricurvum sp.]
MKIKLLLGFFILAWIALIVRVFDLSVRSNEHYETLSQNNSIKTELSPPVRGEILDRRLEPIAINELGFKISLAPHLTKGDDIHLLEQEVNYLLSMIPTLDGKKIIKIYRAEDSYYNHSFIDVVDFVPHETMIPLYALMNLRETIKISPSTKRLYPHGYMGSHIIGYVAKANQKEVENNPLLQLLGHVGKSGIEKYYNNYLQGEAGERRIKVNAHNVEIEEIGRSATQENRNLVLNLDMRLQEYITAAFVGKVGAIVVMDTNGAIYAAGSYPEYDLNGFVEGVSSDQWNYLINSVYAPFTNKIVNGLYPPGSTVKIGMGLVYIGSGKMDESTVIQSTGSMKLGGRTFRDWKKTGHGPTSIVKAIKESCDDYFYEGSLRVGIDTMSRGITRMGLGTKTSIDLPNEFVGTVPSREWKRKRFKQPWFHGDTLNSSIGQGDFLASPIQIADLTALIATGKLPVPHIAKTIGDKEFTPKPRDVLTPLEKQKLPFIQQGMIAVCNEKGGTATGHITSRFPIAGKTGTAQTTGISQNVKNRLDEKSMAYLQRSHAWFTTYGPVENPQFVVTVLVEHGGHGGEVAGEMVSGIYNKLLELGYIKLGQPKRSTLDSSVSDSTAN